MTRRNLTDYWIITVEPWPRRKPTPSLWPTFVLAALAGLGLAWLTRQHAVDPMAQAVGEAIRRLWS